jgi:antirestriction protein ArdC
MFPTYFSVFNAAQIEGIEFPTIEAPATVGDVEITNDPIENAEAILDNYDDSPLLKFDGRNPCYSPADDTIHLPDMGQFNSSANYYKTRFHEEIHGTGAKKRLARTGIVDFDKFGSEQYAREELIAELGACFLSEIAGIQSDDLMEDTAAYCKSWIKKLKNDPKMITFAMSGAQKATEYICGGPLTPELDGAEVSATASA